MGATSSARSVPGNASSATCPRFKDDYLLTLVGAGADETHVCSASCRFPGCSSPRLLQRFSSTQLRKYAVCSLNSGPQPFRRLSFGGNALDQAIRRWLHTPQGCRVDVLRSISVARLVAMIMPLSKMNCAWLAHVQTSSSSKDTLSRPQSLLSTSVLY